MQITKARLKKIIQEELTSLSEANLDYRKVHASMLNLKKEKPQAVKAVGDQHRFVYSDGTGHHLVGLSKKVEDKNVSQYGTYKTEDLTAAEKELESMAKSAVAEVSIKQLRQIIREELGREEVSAEDLVILDIPAPKDDKGNVDEEEAQKRAVEIVMGSEHDQANSFFIDKGRMYFFASADDLRSWQQMTKEDRMDKPAPAAKNKPFTQMSDEELIVKVPLGQMRNRMGGPGRDLFKGVREGDPVPTPTEDLRFVMSQWEDAKSIPGATLSIRRYPDDYKKKHQFDRGRPNMIWGDVNYPSLD